MEEIVVGIADAKVTRGNHILATYALGSCVGICIYDEVSAIGGLLHAMLPDSSTCSETFINSQKYVDTGMQKLYKTLCRMGASERHLRAKVVGGAKMFEYKTTIKAVDIGTANVLQARRCLSRFGIPIAGEVTGGEVGRTIRFNPEDHKVIIHATDGKTEII